MKLLILFFYIGTLLNFGQNKFIEVEVRDTIKLKPLKYLYNVKVENSGLINYDEKNFDYKKSQKIIDSISKDLKVELTKLGYKPMSTNDMNFDVGGYSNIGSEGYMIELENTSQIDKLRNEIKNISYASGHLLDTIYQNRELFTLKIFEKLTKKAKEKAKMIAQFSGIKLGRIIEYREVKEIDNLSFNLMELIIKSQSRLGWSSIIPNDSKGVFSKAIVAKFEGK